MQQELTPRKSGRVNYSLNETDGTATVVAGSEKYSGSAVIPAEVTYGDRTYRVTAIGDNAFIFCDGLSSVVLPDGLTGIGEAAFEGTGISTISIPATVKRIGLNAFLFCSSLTAIEVAGENAAYQSQDGVLFNKGMTRLIVCPAGKSGDYSLPASVEGIEEFAFYCCSGLKSVAFPEGLTSIGRETFNGCSGLTSITLPGSVTSIGFGAFQNCTGLVSFIFPDGVTNIELGMFNMCTGLVSVTLPASLECIENLAFVNCKSLKEVWMRAATPPTVGGSLVFVGLPTGGYYALAGGELLQAASGAADLAPFRWYMQAVSRMTGENVTLPARIRLRVIDGNGTATGIDAPGLAPVVSPSGIYTLDGLPKGIYVVNGRKVVR